MRERSRVLDGVFVVGVAAAAVIGAIIGDNILYFLGRRFGPRLADRLFRGATSRKRLDRAQRRFIWPEVIAVLLWAAYYVCAPVLFGGTLPGSVTIGVSIGIAIVLGGIAEFVRRLLERREDPTPESSAG